MQLENTPLTPAQRAERESSITQFVERHAPGPNADLYGSMIRTICRMAKDGTSRADAKLVDRALQELRYAFKIFDPYGDTPKVTIFGSSRTPEGHPEYIQAMKFAERMRQSNWMVITGAGDGIMKAGHGGAGREASFGVAISLPFEQKTNEIIEGDQKLINFKYFFTRKLMFMKEAKAVALFPGGFGTQDEGFEVMTLIQTGKAMMLPIVCLDAPGGTYWQHWRTYVKAELLQPGMISSEDMSLFMLTDNVETAVQEILRFYRRFHSYRFVHEKMVMRLKTPLPDSAVAQISHDYSDLLSGGTFEQSTALEEEGDDQPDLPRLIFQFNRRSLGRLRQLIDYINMVDLPRAGSTGMPGN